MANVNAPFGLRPVAKLAGSNYMGSVRAYSTAAGDGTALYIGDPVKLAGTGQLIAGQTYSDVTAYSVGDVMAGVVVACAPNYANTELTYRAASTQRIVYVCDDPGAVFEVQDITGGTALTANDIGLNISLVSGAGSTVTGLSGWGLDNTTEATTNTLNFQLVGLSPRPDNAIGDSAIFLVRCNKHQFANQVAGV